MNKTLIHPSTITKTLGNGIATSQVLTSLLDLMEEPLMDWSTEKTLSSSKLVYHLS